MSNSDKERRIQELEKELAELRSQLKVNEEKEETNASGDKNHLKNFSKCPLSNIQIERYSRQMILPEIGVKGQVKLQKSSVLVVGTGGLGCPAALYMTSAGIGTIGLLDYDVVDLSNLHRQVLHTEDKLGIGKVQSAIQDLRRLNSDTKFIQHNVSLTSDNALAIIKDYDIVLDCTDNVATRYLLNDACIFTKKPLVSGSALRFEGQLIVYNYMDGPCYRCLYPTPPPPETVTNCSDGGVVGAVTGVIGSLQALEAIKIISNETSSYSGKLLLYDGLAGSFRSIKLRGRQDTCSVCGMNPSIKKLQDYEQFCGSKATDKDAGIKVLSRENRLTVEEYEEIKKNDSQDHILIDVRSHVEYEICSLQPSINICLKDIEWNKNIDVIKEAINDKKQVFIVCKRGNDSQRAVQHLAQLGMNEENIKIKDLIGGLHAWSLKIDRSFPKY